MNISKEFNVTLKGLCKINMLLMQMLRVECH